MRVGDRVQLDAGDAGVPWCTVHALLDNDRVEVKMSSGAPLIVPASMLRTTEVRRVARKRR